MLNPVKHLYRFVEQSERSDRNASLSWPPDEHGIRLQGLLLVKKCINLCQQDFFTAWPGRFHHQYHLLPGYQREGWQRQQMVFVGPWFGAGGGYPLP